jgi:hypothetical protein
VGVATATLDVALAAPEVVEEAGGVKTDDEAGRSVGVRYQFASGSPKHSPNVTSLYPFLVITSSIWPVRFCAVCW